MSASGPSTEMGAVERSGSKYNSNPQTQPGIAPPYLPPRSPSSSLSGKFLLTASNRSTVPRRRKSQNKRRERKEGKPTVPAPSSPPLHVQTEANPDQSLEDPCPDHLNVADSDDLSNLADFSPVSLDERVSPKSVAESSLPGGESGSRRKHRKAKSWDSGDSYQASSSQSKSCLPVPALFRRGKVMCADVASVSNASDTVVPVEKEFFSGREIHESAKTALNAGNYTEAVALFDAIRKAQVERFGEDHPSVGAALHNVGVVRLRMEQHEEAEAVLARAVVIRRVVLGGDHLELAASLAKLGSARVVLQKFDSALQDLREALRINRKTLGRCHKTVAQTLCHIACLYFEAGELYSAQATFEDALEIYREVFSTETHRDSCMAQMTEALCNIGSIHNKRKNFSEAIQCFKEALDLQRGILGHNNPRVIATLDNLGYSYSKLKAHNQALTCYKEMLTAQLSRYGAFTTECCDTLKKQNLMNEKLKNLDGAIDETKRTLGGLRREMHSSSPVVAATEKILADLVVKRGRRQGSF